MDHRRVLEETAMMCDVLHDAEARLRAGRQLVSAA